MKCALDCVHSCLAKCHHATEVHASSGGASGCYAECTKPCLPKCAAGGVETSSEAPQTATPVESSSVEAKTLPRR